jgi:hypothetical protein
MKIRLYEVTEVGQDDRPTIRALKPSEAWIDKQLDESGERCVQQGQTCYVRIDPALPVDIRSAREVSIRYWRQSAPHNSILALCAEVELLRATLGDCAIWLGQLQGAFASGKLPSNPQTRENLAEQIGRVCRLGAPSAH